MTGVIANVPKQQFFDNKGNPAVGYDLYTYLAGTATPATTYQDAALSIANTNPIVLDARGECAIWGDPGKQFKFVLKDSLGTIINTLDNVTTTPAGVPLLTDLANASDMAKGAALIGGVGRVVDSIAKLRSLPKTGTTRAFVAGYYTPGDGGGGQYWLDAADTTTADNGGTVVVAADGGRWKLSSTGVINVKQFGAKGDGVTDDTTAIQNALNTNRSVFFPQGIYQASSALVFSAQNNTAGAGRVIYGEAMGDANSTYTHGACIRLSGTNDGLYCTDSLPYVTIRDLSIIGGNTSGRGIYFTGTCAESLFQNLGIYTGKQAIYMPNLAGYGMSFSNNFINCHGSSWTTSVFEIAGGPGTNFLGCYVHNFPATAGVAGFRIYSTANFYGCNAVDVGGTALIAGQWTGAGDGLNNPYVLNVHGCNFEAFSVSGIELRYQGVARIQGSLFAGLAAGYTASIIQNGPATNSQPIVVDSCVFENSTANFQQYSGAWWQASWYYAKGAIVQTGSGATARLYVCKTAGTSAASGGPSGTGTGIVDNTVTWDYLAPAAQVRTAKSELYVSNGGQPNFLVYHTPSLGAQPQVDFTGTVYDCGGSAGISNLNGKQIAEQSGGKAMNGPLTLLAPEVNASGLLNAVVLGNRVATTVGAAGAASALPATPLGYLIANVYGTTVKIPYYNN